MKKQRKTPVVLVIGADGMVGSFLFSYFSRILPNTTFGTSRKKSKKKNVFYLSVETAKKDLQKIHKKIHIDFTINCVVEKDENNIFSLIKVNALFPHILETDALSNKYFLF